MTIITTNDKVVGNVEDSERSSVSGTVGRLTGWVEKIADRANPILVKETRQALKSRQFVLTFLIVLVACWVATFGVPLLIGPSVHYGAEGPGMLIYYCMILAFPLFLIVPYSAFRSLAVEQEDNTYELLSITTLTTSQIVTGKLGSVIVQMLVYYSAVSPCIAFTFLLRGLDTLTVGLLLFYFFLTSLGFSMLALFAGTLAKARFMQGLLSVLLVLCLGTVYYNSYEIIEDFLSDAVYFTKDDEFWIANSAFLTFFVTSFALVHTAAASRIAFASENRSTRLRVVMLIQQACFLGWMCSFPSRNEYAIATLVTGMVAGVYWYFMGVFMTSEWPHLSRRVQRNLPSSQMGRAFLTWLNPGPGTGYMFSVANLTMILGVGILTISLNDPINIVGTTPEQAIAFLGLGWCYVTLFLGLGKLLISLVRSFLYVSMTAGVLLHIILFLAACGTPQVIGYLSSSSRFSTDYSILHMSNPIWTLMQFVDRGAIMDDFITIFVAVGCSSIVVLLLNIRILGAELHYQRRALPSRVLEEEKQLQPVNDEIANSPWDGEKLQEEASG